METTIGIFPNRQTAVAAGQELRSAGVAEEQLTLIEPRSSLAETSAVTPPQPEPPGACGANTENVQGSILGFAGGLLGSSILALALPGIGPIAAVGVLGLGSAVGSVAGGVLGQAAREATATELTPQEFVTYEHALQKGDFLLVVQHSEERRKQDVLTLLARQGAKDFDLAFDEWWKTVRAEERTATAASAEEFRTGEHQYRDGFVTALAAYGRKSECGETSEPNQYKDATNTPEAEAFDRGYTRGRQYYETLLRQHAQKNEQSANT